MIRLPGTRLMGSLLFVIAALLMLLASGCKSDYTPVPQSAIITEDDMADMIGASLAGSGSSNGLVSQIGEAAAVAGGDTLHPQPFGKRAAVPGADTVVIVRHDTVGTNSYNFTFRYVVTFQNANDLLFRYSMGGWYSTARISSQDSALALLEVSGITATDSAYTLSATYSRTGTQISKVRSRISFSSSLDLTMSAVRILKSTKELLSGSADITISGRYSGSQFFSYVASLVITGPQTSTLTINSKAYVINLATGTATRT